MQKPVMKHLRTLFSQPSTAWLLALLVWRSIKPRVSR